MSRRERIGLMIGLLAAVVLVAYPLGYRVATGWAGDSHRALDVKAIQLPTPKPDPTPTPAPSPAPTPTPERIEVEPSSADDAETGDTFGRVPAAWAATAADLRSDIGRTFEYDCPAEGRFGDVWGTTIYTDDSSVCTAAVHAGVITERNGGTVTIIVRPGQSSYLGSLQNGVESQPYGGWGGSFTFLAP